MTRLNCLTAPPLVLASYICPPKSLRRVRAGRLNMPNHVQKFEFFLLTPKKKSIFVSTSNSDCPRNSRHKNLSLVSVRDFLRRIKRNYVFYAKWANLRGHKGCLGIFLMLSTSNSDSPGSIFPRRIEKHRLSS